MKAVAVKAVMGIKEVLETGMNLIYPSQRIILIRQQLDLNRIVSLAGEAELLDQDAVDISIVGPQNKEYFLQSVSGGGEGVTVVPGIRVDADVSHGVLRRDL